MSADPRAFILQQLDGKWQSIAMALMFKLSRDKPVVITGKDLEALHRFLGDGDRQLLTWGHKDSIELRIMKREDAERLAAHAEESGGKAVRPQ